MTNKVVASVATAINNIKDGATILIGGFNGVGHPTDLIDAILQKGVRDLTIVGNTIALAGPLVLKNRVKKFICTLPKTKLGTAKINSTVHAANQFRAGGMAIEVIPQATMIERVRAASAGLGGFYTPVGIGTRFADGRETRTIDGIDYLFEMPIHADFAIIYADTADRLGNLVYKGSGRSSSHYMASGAKYTIVQANKIVEPGTIAPEQVHTAGIFVDCVIQSRTEKTLRLPRDTTDDEVGNLIAGRVARDIPTGSVVELGFGLPWYVADHFTKDQQVLVHSEGVLGVERTINDDGPETHWRGADGRVLKMIPGASHFDFVDSFNMIMSGRIDYALLGAFQVDALGNFAGWATDDPDRLPAPGASIEIALKSKNVYILTKHLDRNGNSKILPQCTFPVTATGVVKRIYTDLATLAVTPNGLQVVDIVGNMLHNTLEELTGIKLIPKEQMKETNARTLD